MRILSHLYTIFNLNKCITKAIEFQKFETQWLFYYEYTNTWATNKPPPKINTKTTIGHTNLNQCEYFISNICNVAIINPVGAKNSIAYCPN